jgi:O-antigen ligase
VLKALLFFLLLYVVNQVHFPWETHIPGLAVNNVVFLLALFAMRGRPDEIEVEGQLKRPMLLLMGMLTFGFLLAQILEFDDFVADATAWKNNLFFLLFYFLFLHCRQDEKTTRQLIIWVMVIAAVAGVEAIREGFDYGFGKYNPMRRASGPFGTDWRASNVAGVFYAMFMPMFVALALFLRKRKLWRLASIAGIVLIGGGTLFTYSRQSYFIVLFSTLILLIRRSIVAAVVIGVTLVSLAGYLPDSVTQRVEETKQTGKHGEEVADLSTASRWEIWEGAMGMVKEHPIGVGMSRFVRHIGEYSSHKNIDAHNFYVLTLAECGPQALIAFFYLLWRVFALAKWMRQHAPPDDPEAQALTIGFTATTLCMAMGGIYGSPLLREGAVMAPYWALAGLLERYIHLKMKHADQSATGPREATLVERFPLAVHARPQAT